MIEVWLFRFLTWRGCFNFLSPRKTWKHSNSFETPKVVINPTEPHRLSFQFHFLTATRFLSNLSGKHIKFISLPHLSPIVIAWTNNFLNLNSANKRKRYWSRSLPHPPSVYRSVNKLTIQVWAEMPLHFTHTSTMISEQVVVFHFSCYFLCLLFFPKISSNPIRSERETMCKSFLYHKRAEIYFNVFPVFSSQRRLKHTVSGTGKKGRKITEKKFANRKKQGNFQILSSGMMSSSCAVLWGWVWKKNIGWQKRWKM